MADRAGSRRLHIFDLDGTLIRGSAATVEISRQLGLLEEIAELERDISAGRIGPPEYAVRVHAMWTDLTEAHVAAAFDSAPWLDGIREVWNEIRAGGDYCAVISLSPSFFVERLLGWGAHAAHGSRFPDLPFSRPVDPSGVLSASAKVRIAENLCAEFGVGLDSCVAYGDSGSDREIFAVVPTTVAVNADSRIAGVATHVYAGGDLREAYELVRSRG